MAQSPLELEIRKRIRLAGRCLRAIAGFHFCRSAI